MASNAGFFNTAIKDLKTIGSITSSSSHLVHSMLEPVGFQSSKLILELGAGNGCITDSIIERMHADSKLLVFELNDDFYQRLSRIKDPRVSCLNRNATELLEWVDPHTVDVIISALPLAIIGKAEKRQILQSSVSALKKGGVFVQFQYSLKDLRNMKNYFEHVSVKFELFNIPPAFIYVCTV